MTADGLRILLLSAAYPPVVGGAETYAAVMASGLARLGHDVLVATDETGDAGQLPGPPQDCAGCLRIRRLSRYRGLLDDPSKLRWEQLLFGLLPELASIIGDWRPDVVLTNGLETAVLGRIAAAEFGIPLVAAFHEHAPQDDPFGQGKLALGYQCAAPDAIIAGSASYRARALRLCGPDRVHLIHHGVDTRSFSPCRNGTRIRARYGLSPDQQLVVSAGRLKPRKGHQDLIKAFAAIDPARAHLVIAGSISSASPDYARQTDALIDALSLRDKVTIDQEITLAQMPELFAASDVVAQPSYSEGLGLALLEAMSTARPCIATRIDGHAEVLGESSAAGDLVELVAPGHVDGLAGALGRLLADRDRRHALGQAARRYVELNFSQRLMLDRTAALLHDVVRRGPAGAR